MSRWHEEWECAESSHLGFTKKIVCLCVWTCLTHRYIYMFQHATGTSKTCGFQSLGYRIFSQTAVTTVTQCLCGSLPTLRSRGVPTISSVFFQHTGSGTDFFRKCGVRCCCPAPSSIEAEASPQPPGLVPSPAHSQGHRAHFEGVCHQYHFPRLDLLPFYCPGPVRPPLPPPGRRWPLWAHPCSPGVRFIPKDLQRPPLQIQPQGPTLPSPVSSARASLLAG